MKTFFSITWKYIFLYFLLITLPIVYLNAQNISVSIDGPITSCSNTSGLVYTASVQNGGTNITYNWSVTNGTITNGQGTTSLTVTSGSAGTMTINLTVDDDESNPFSTSLNVTITPDVETPIFVLGNNSTRCQGNDKVIYTATSNNSTSIIYSLAPSSAGSFNSSTGEVNYLPNFFGIATITVTAQGCNGPKSASHIATTKQTPTVNVGSNQSICQNGTTSGLGGTVGGSATGGIWTSNIGGTFNPTDQTLNATWTAPNGFTGPATLTLTTVGMDPCIAVSKNLIVSVNSSPSASISYNNGQAICKNTGNYSPTIMGVNTGTFTSNPAGLSINSTTGVINSSLSSDGTYTVTYTIAAIGGCTVFTTSTTVKISSVGAVTLSTNLPGNAVCFGNPIIITANPSNMQYLWSTGESTNPITNNSLPVGNNNVAVTITNSDGCKNNGNIQVVVKAIPSRPTLNVSENPTCTGKTVTFNATGSGTFMWTGPNSFSSNLQNPVLSNISLNAEGNYLCKITVNGCTSDESSLFLEVNETPNITSISQTNPILTCNGCEGIITINGLQANTTYTIRYQKNGILQLSQNIQTNSSGGLLITNLCKGIYSNFDVTLSNCTRNNSTSITLSDPLPPLKPTTNQFTNRSFCADTFPIPLIVNPISGIEMNWYKDGVPFVQNQNTITINDAGFYEVEAFNSITRCVSSSKLGITVVKVQNPASPTINPSDYIRCQNELPLTLTASPPSNSTLFWFNQATGGTSITTGNSFTHSNTNPAIYHYFIESKLNALPQCKSLSRTEVTVTINANPAIPTLPPNKKDTAYFCQSEIPSNSRISVNFVNNESTNWYQTASGGSPIQSGSNDFLHTNQNVGTYSYFVESQNNTTGCKSTVRKRIVVVVKPTPQMVSATDKSFCPGDNVQINFSSNPTGATFTWKNDNSNTGLNSLSGNGNIQFTAKSNFSATDEISNILVTPALNGCVGEEKEFIHLTLNPTPQLEKIIETTCSGLQLKLPEFSISPIINGTQNYIWKNINNSVTGLSTNGTGQINPFTIPDNNTGNNINGLIEFQVSVKNCPSRKDTLKLTIFPKPTITNTLSEASGITSNDKIICENDKVTVQANGSNSVPPYSFMWNDNSTSNVIIDFPQGPISGFINKTYTVTVTDKNSCTNQTSTTIEINKYPLVEINQIEISGINANDKTICSKDKIDLEAIESGGSRPTYQFLWNVNNATTEKISLNPITNLVQQDINYRVTVTNSGCKTIDSINIKVMGLPQAKYQIITTELEPNAPITFKDLSVKNGGFNINNWKWTFQNAKKTVIDTNINVSVAAEFPKPGKYGVSLKVTDENNCMSTVQDSVYINNSNCPINFRDNFPTKYCLDKATNSVTIKLEIEQKQGFTSEMKGVFDNLGNGLTFKTMPSIGGSTPKIYTLEIIATKKTNFSVRLNVNDPNNSSDGCRQITIAQSIDVYDAPDGNATIKDGSICKGNSSSTILKFSNGVPPYHFKYNNVDSITNDSVISIGIVPNDYKNLIKYEPCLSYLSYLVDGKECINTIINACTPLNILQLPIIDTLSKSTFCQNQQDSSTIIHTFPIGSSSFKYEWINTDSRISILPLDQKRALITLEKDKTGSIPITIKVTDTKSGCSDTKQNTIIISKGEAPKIDTFSRIYTENSDPSKGYILVYPDPNLCYLWEEDTSGNSGFKPANCYDSNNYPYCEPSSKNLTQNSKFQVKIWYKTNGVCPDFSTTCYNTATKSRNSSFDSNIQNPLQLLVIPNPNDGNFSLKLTGGLNGNYRVLLIDDIGEKIIKSSFTKSFEDVKLDFNYDHLTNGLYYLHLLDEEGNRFLQKIIVQH